MYPKHLVTGNNNQKLRCYSTDCPLLTNDKNLLLEQLDRSVSPKLVTDFDNSRKNSTAEKPKGKSIFQY
jgi:hypothetical protein